MKKLFILNIFLITVSSVQAQYTEEKQDSLVSYLDEVVVSANKIPEQRRAVAQQIKIVTPSFMKNLNAQTSADLLQNTGVVAMQKSQQGGGSPMLRGFEASKVLLMIDGVRMNNLIYRAGHLQNVITMDNNILDHAEIAFGPSSTVYGSDALGGVVHFYSRNPELSKEKKFQVSGNVFTRLGSANNEKTEHIDINLAGKKIASLTSFTFSDFGDLKMGEKENPSLGEPFGLRTQYVQRLADNSGDELITNSNPYVQKFSGYKQYDVLQKLLFTPGERVEHLINFQYSTSSDIPRYDRLTDPQGAGLRSAQWYYGPQKRLMASYQLKVKNPASFADALATIISYQTVEESRHDRRFNNNNLNHRADEVDVCALTIDLQKKMGASNLRYGLDSQFNFLTSMAYRENISTGMISPVDTRYPDGDNSLNYYALYATHTWLISDKWILNDGIRFGGSSLKATFIDKSFFPFPYDDIQQNNSYASGNLGVIFNPTSWKFSLMGSSGYRVPNIDDLAKVFESVVGSTTTTGTLLVPNPDLKPEKTFNVDFGMTKFFGDKARVEAVGFATQYFDAIAVRPSTFNGQSTIDYQGYPATVMSSQNVAQAYIYGWNALTSIDLIEQLSVTAAYNYTHGRAKVEGGPDVPLDHIPPQFGRVGIVFHTVKFRSELFSNFNGKKYLSDYSSSGEDNLQYAPVSGMPSWYTINVRLSYDAGKFFTLQGGIDNIMDLQYRQFASGINSPGRNFFGTLRMKF